MPTYEVSYEVVGATNADGHAVARSELIEASGPVEATRLFHAQPREEQVIVLCVVRQ